MTINQFLNGIIYVGTLVAAVMGIGAFAHFLIIKPIRGFLRKEIVANLVKITEAIELSHKSFAELDSRLSDHIDYGGHFMVPHP